MAIIVERVLTGEVPPVAVDVDGSIGPRFFDLMHNYSSERCHVRPCDCDGIISMFLAYRDRGAWCGRRYELWDNMSGW
ncbi:MAG: hypothetical protein FWD57_08760 [Polyangiaceae bacterium]|nr:hypothetical protein [Polyangiaceae bacterium]